MNKTILLVGTHVVAVCVGLGLARGLPQSDLDHRRSSLTVPINPTGGVVVQCGDGPAVRLVPNVVSTDGRWTRVEDEPPDTADRAKWKISLSDGRVVLFCVSVP